MKAILMNDIERGINEAHLRIDMDATDEVRHRIEKEFIKFFDAVKEILNTTSNNKNTEYGSIAIDVPTCELVKELEKREAVSTIIAEPYQDVSYKVNGPATILIVTD